MSQKRKILFISPGPKYNLSYLFKERCEKLSEMSSGAVITSGPLDCIEHYGNYEVLCVRDPWAKSWVSTLKFFWFGLKYLRGARKSGEPYEFLVTYDPLKSGLIGAVLCMITGCKLVVEVNGDYTDDVIYFEMKHFWVRKLKKFLMVNVERRVLNCADAIKLLYDSQIDYFKPLSKQPLIDRFPDFVSTKDFSNLGEDKVVLLVGFPFWVKGVDILIEAFKEVAADFPDWQLKILGYYPDKAELEKHTAGHPQIFHHPPVDPSEMPEHIGRCGVFVLPSRTEAMGRVLLESMAAGKPRIGSNTGGIPTVIEDEVDGLLFESESPNSLALQLKRLLIDSKLRKRLGARARKRYEDEFRPEHYFERLNKFYSSI